MIEKIKSYIQKWEQNGYSDGIPDEAPYELEIRNKVPSYRKICIAIMKNDYQCKTLGYTNDKSIYYNELKYQELYKKGKITQTRLPI